MKKFNVQPTYEAFLTVKPQMTDLLTLCVHEDMFEGPYLKKHTNYLRKVLTHLEETKMEVLLVTMIGMLSLRMPNDLANGHWVAQDDGTIVWVKRKWDDHQNEEMKKIGAGVLINILVDSGEYEVISKTKENTDSTGKTTFASHLYLVFNGVTPTKELTYGLETEPGVFYQKMVGDMRLSGKFKEYLSKVGSWAFKASDVMTEALILHGYKLSKDYRYKNPHSFGESDTARRERYRDYAKFIMKHIAPMERFYLPMKYDSRSRMYYLFQLIGMRPQGHLWETCFIDAAVPKLLDDSAIGHLKHIIYVAKYGRCSLEHAVSKFTHQDWEWAADIDPLQTTTEDDFGIAILVGKASFAINQCMSGIPTHYLFGKDLTNSGLMMAAANFKSPRMLKASNLRKLKTVHDSYEDMRIAYGLEGVTRKQMKGICTPMLHGASNKSLLRNVHSAMLKNGVDENTANSVDLAFIYKANREAFGPEVENIYAISTWGAEVVTNTRTKLLWTTPDGFKAYHRAHIAYCPVIINVATASVKACYREHQMVSDMPLKQQANGMPLFTKDHVAKGAKHSVVVKKMGLYANLTHGMDASLLREVVDLVDSKGEVCLLKHDDYMAFADTHDEIVETAQQFFVTSSEVNYYQQALEEIAKRGEISEALPILNIGEGKVEASVNFLMP